MSVEGVKSPAPEKKSSVDEEGEGLTGQHRRQSGLGEGAAFLVEVPSEEGDVSSGVAGDVDAVVALPTRPPQKLVAHYLDLSCLLTSVQVLAGKMDCSNFR